MTYRKVSYDVFFPYSYIVLFVCLVSGLKWVLIYYFLLSKKFSSFYVLRFFSFLHYDPSVCLSVCLSVCWHVRVLAKQRESISLLSVLLLLFFLAMVMC